MLGQVLDGVDGMLHRRDRMLPQLLCLLDHVLAEGGDLGAPVGLSHCGRYVTRAALDRVRNSIRDAPEVKWPLTGRWLLGPARGCDEVNGAGMDPDNLA